MKKFLMLLFISLIFLSACVYYNTFYNAEQYFEQAQNEELKDNGKPTRSAIQNYNKAMQKCGVILTDYKKSKWADDALFMLAQCLFYQKTKLIEAKEKFEEVIKFYPDSDYAQRSHIYIARCYKEMNQEEKAYKKLREFIVTEGKKDFLPEALMQIADYYREDEIYSQAEFYYQKLIDEHPKSNLHKDAFLALGILYYKNENYVESIKTFEAFLKIKADKKEKLAARYYIAKNNLLAGNLSVVEEQIEELLEDEYRQQEIDEIMLLKARFYALSGETDLADGIFEQIITENSRTLLAAESSYWRAEMHFRILNDYEKAIEYYNNVRSENAQSEFVEMAVNRSAVASQILQYSDGSSDIELNQLINEQMKLAEYYQEVLSLPDSAMAVYDRIILRKEQIALKIDSLQTELDSLNYIQEINTSQNDSLPAINDSLFTSADSLQTMEDSLVMVLQDSIPPEQQNIQPTRADTLRDIISQLESDMEAYENKFVPYMYFVKMWMRKSVYKDTLAAENLLQEMQSRFPQNRYTYAAKDYMHNEAVSFTTPEEEMEKREYENALDMVQSNPDSALVLLQEVASDSTSQFYNPALYTIGYIHFHLKSDTLAAKPFFKKILKSEPGSPRAEKISVFFDGESFIQIDRLPALVDLEKRLAEEKEEEKVTDQENAEGENNEDYEDNENEEDSDTSSGLPDQGVTPRSPRPKN